MLTLPEGPVVSTVGSEFSVTRWDLAASELRRAGGPRVIQLNTQENSR